MSYPSVPSRRKLSSAQDVRNSRAKMSKDVKIFTNDEVSSLRSQVERKDNLSFVCLNHADFLEQLKHEEEVLKNEDNNNNNKQNNEIQPNRSNSPVPQVRGPPPGSRGAPPKIARGALRGNPQRARGRGRGRGLPPSAHRSMKRPSDPNSRPTTKKLGKTKSQQSFVITKQRNQELVIEKPKDSLPDPPPGFDFVPSLGYYMPTLEARKLILSQTDDNNKIKPTIQQTGRRNSFRGGTPKLKPTINVTRSHTDNLSTNTPDKKGPRIKSQNIKKIQSKPLQELIITEKEYLNDINNVIIDIFLKPIRKKKLLNKFEIVSIFSNIETIASVNKKLYSDLQKNKLNIGEIFSQFAKDMKRSYAIYCSNQPNVRDTLIEYKKQNEDFAKFIKSCFKKSECRKLDLESFLIIPLQRLCKYPLLLKEIQKDPSANQDSEVLQKALDEIRNVVDEVNTRVQEVENLVKLMSIANQISNGGKWPIIDPMRQFYMESDFHISGSKKYGFLFNDALLLCELEAKNNEQPLIAFRMLPLSLCVLTDLPASDEYKYQFELIEIGKDKLIVTCPTSLKKRKWYKALDTLIAQNSGPQDDLARESVAQIKAVKPVTVTPRKKVRKKKSKLTQMIQSDVVQNNPKIVALKQQITQESKAREKAEMESEKLKNQLQSLQNKESKQQTVSDLQKRIGELCGVVGSLSANNAQLQQQLTSYQEEIDKLAS